MRTRQARGCTVHFPAAAAGSATNVYQVVCSPIRNPLSGPIRVLNACASFVVAGLVGRALAKTARVPRSPFDWTVSSGPYFHNVRSGSRLVCEPPSERRP